MSRLQNIENKLVNVDQEETRMKFECIIIIVSISAFSVYKIFIHIMAQ